MDSFIFKNSKNKAKFQPVVSKEILIVKNIEVLETKT